MLYLAARDLEPAGFSVFGVFWGAFGLVTGAANGLLQEATREVRSTRYTEIAGPRTHPMRVAAMVGVVAAAVIAGSSPLWSGYVFVESRVLSVVLLSVGLAGFCLHATLLGMLAGVGRWTQYGSLMVTDAVIRVTVAAATFVLGWHLAGFLWATVAGSVAWLIMLIASPATREAARLLTPGGTVTFLRGASHSIAAAGASAVLVMGFPGAAQGDLGRSRCDRRCGDPGGDADPCTADGSADGDAGQPDRPLRRPARPPVAGPGGTGRGGRRPRRGFRG